MSTSDPANTIIARLSQGLLTLWRIMVGLIAAIIIAPMLTGFLVGLSSWPTDGIGAYVSHAAIGALLFLYVGIATSFTAVVIVVVPGILLARWMGLMSPRTCTIGGALVCMFPFTGYAGFTASTLPIDWRLLGVALCGGGVAGWIYWWIAERPLRGMEIQSDGSSGDR